MKNKLITTIKKQKSFIIKYLIFMLIVIPFSMVPEFIRQDDPILTLNDNMMRLIMVIITILVLLLWIIIGLSYPHLIGLSSKKE